MKRQAEHYQDDDVMRPVELRAFRLEVPPRSTSVALARLFAASIARHFDCDDETVEDVKIAVSETVTNAVKAHLSDSCEEPVIVSATVEGSTIKFSVVDQGPGFDFEAVARAAQKPAMLSRGSLGLALVRSLFSTTQLRHNADRGMTVEFSCGIGGAATASP